MNTKSMLKAAALLLMFSACTKSEDTNPKINTPSEFTVAGKVTSISKKNIADAEVTLTYDNKTFSTKTDAAGIFKFVNVPIGVNPVLSASYVDVNEFYVPTQAEYDANSLEIGKIIQNTSGLNQLSKLAADVNNSNSVTSIDIVDLRNTYLTKITLKSKWIVGSDAFGQGKSTKKSIELTNLQSDIIDLQFLGAKVGDPLSLSF
jgi:hypothetical protein